MADAGKNKAVTRLAHEDVWRDHRLDRIYEMNAPRGASERQYDAVAAAQGRRRWVKRMRATCLWFATILFVLVGSVIGAAVLKPHILGFSVGLASTTCLTFIVLARRAFPPHRRKLWYWIPVGAAVIYASFAFDLVITVLLIAIAEGALAWLAVSKDNWVTFDAAQLIETEPCPMCGKPRLHTAQRCRHCGTVFAEPAQTS